MKSTLFSLFLLAFATAALFNIVIYILDVRLGANGLFLLYCQLGPVAGLLHGYGRVVSFAVIGAVLGVVVHAFRQPRGALSIIAVPIAVALWYVCGIIFIGVLE